MNDESAMPGPAYRIETDRLKMRCWSPLDARCLREALDDSDQHLRPWIPFMKDEPCSLEKTAARLRGIRASFDSNEHFRYAVFDRGERDLIGENMLLSRAGPGALEIGYLTFKGHTGSGFASEATCAMIRLAFEVHRVERVEIHCSPGNQASAAIPKRLGFNHDATLRRRVTDSEGDVHDLMVWSLLSGEYPRSPSAELAMSAFDCLDEPLIQGVFRERRP